MTHPSTFHKQLGSIMENFVTATLSEICRFGITPAINRQNNSQPSENDCSLKNDIRLRRLTSFMRRLAKSATAQITELVSDEGVGPQEKISRYQKENNALKRKLRLLESQLTLPGKKKKLRRVKHRPNGAADKDTTTRESLAVSGHSQTPASSGKDVNFSPSATVKFEDGPTQVVEATDVEEAEAEPESADCEADQVEVSYGPSTTQGTLTSSQGETAVGCQRDGQEEGAYILNSTDEPVNMTLKVAVSEESIIPEGRDSAVDPALDDSTEKNLEIELKNQSEVKQLQCEQCGETFTYANNLRRHRKNFHSDGISHGCPDCGETFCSKSLLRAHRKVHKVQKPHICVLCEKRFHRPNHLKNHMASHSDERPFSCSVCEKTFFLSSILKAHQKTHSGEKPFACKECGASFLTKSYLDYHQRVHTGEKPHSCSHCGKSFAQKSNLRAHERIHTKEKPFKCEVCGESFIHANSYKSHKQLHTGIRAYCCEICGKGFRRGTHLKTHLLTHSGDKPFSCDVCGKRFPFKSVLKSHQFIHTGAKNYPCEVCCKSFRQANSLAKHRLTHTGEKPHKCDRCNKSFRQRSHLKTHQWTHVAKNKDPSELETK